MAHDGPRNAARSAAEPTVFAGSCLLRSFSDLGPRRVKSVDPLTAETRRLHRHVGFVPNSEVARLFDHLVGTGYQGRWHFETKGFRSLQIDDQLEFGWLEKGDISGIGAFEDLIDDVGNYAVDFPEVD